MMWAKVYHRNRSAGRGATMGEVVLNNERDNFEVGRGFRLKKVFGLHYRNHEFDAFSD
jgi:hypothetical protein